MVKCGEREYVSIFQTEKKQFYIAGDTLGAEDFGKLYPTHWKPLTEKQRKSFKQRMSVWANTYFEGTNSI